MQAAVDGCGGFMCRDVQGAWRVRVVLESARDCESRIFETWTATWIATWTVT